MAIAGLAEEIEALREGRFEKERVREMDRLLSANGCPYCGKHRLRLTRLLIHAVESVADIDEPKQQLLISFVCLDCRCSEPLTIESVEEVQAGQN